MNKSPALIVKLPLILSAAVLISSCSGIPFLGGQQNAYVPPKIKALKEIAAKSAVTKRWQIDTGSPAGDNKLRLYIDSGAIYSAGSTGIAAWDKTTGKSLWKSALRGVSGGVNGGNNMVFAGTRDGKAIALDAKTGNIKWIAPVQTEVLAISPESDGRVAFRTIDGKLHGLDSSNGELIWQRQQRTPEIAFKGASVPVVVDKGLITGFDNGNLAAYYMETGRPIWEISIASVDAENSEGRLVDIDGRLKPLGNALFASNPNGQIVGANMSTGEVAWQKAFSSYAGADADAKGVYSTDSKGHIWRLAPLTGKPIWSQDSLENRLPTAPILAAGGSRLVVGDAQGNIHWLDAEKGQFIARLKGDPAGYEVPAINDGGVVYALGKGGILTAMQTAKK